MEEIVLGTRDIKADLLGLLNSELPFTDLLLQKNTPVMAKLPTGWTEVQDFLPLTDDDVITIVEGLDSDYINTLKKRAINRPLTLTNWRLRINAYLALENIMMSIRRVPINPPELKTLGLPASVRLLLEAPRGLLLVSGATGSGKTTTVAAIIEEINLSKQSHIVTIEDPVEFVYKRKKAVFSQREIGVDATSFYEGARDAMRQCPNVIVIGEIRDKETADTALLASESGHLVIGTLHANSAVGTVQKLLGFFPEQERSSRAQSLAINLVGIINQILLPKIDGTGYSLAAEVLANHKQQFSNVLDDPTKLASALDRNDDKVSVNMAESLAELVRKNAVSKLDAIKASFGSPALYEKLRV
ncbi:type IV pilus twitching motility protein PilT [Methylovorus glucosotrophus]|uniref:Type II secretion system protein E n=1 Tax=Methylovorus glucosotrophus (strain SIP3-4) TaxID=582744 RepID=C6XET7_METGS|nr:ATPase, T2SS/T4P/T4SS family [Methylovorus glucosotrophus]ACT52144.1 type II secretion system protein E [Methylovorus glucosotrophus SIP3-4]